MRTEVKIGLVICVLAAALVIALSMFRGGDDPVAEPSDAPAASKPAATPAPVTKPAAKPAVKPVSKPGLSLAPAPEPKRPQRTSPAKPVISPSITEPPVSTAKPFDTVAPKRPVNSNSPALDYSAIRPSKPATSTNNPVSVSTSERSGGLSGSPIAVSTSRPAVTNLKPQTNTPVAPVRVPASSKPSMYVVQQGDSGFYYIAQKLYGSQRYAYLIRNANPNAESTRLRVGQKLIIPPLPKNSDTSRQSSAAVTPTGGKIHVVQEGDVAWNLAKKYYGNGKYTYLLEKANKNVNLDRLIIGQKLVIPPFAAPSSSGQTAGTAGGSGGRIYTVEPGDSAWKISERFYGSGKYVEAIANANSGVDIDNLKVGQKLTIPNVSGIKTGSSVSAPSSASGSTPSTGTGRGGYTDPRPMFD